MARRSDHTREELKNLILDTSFKLVKTHGFEQLSARRISTEIGYAPGTIYNLFDSMDDLYVQVNARTLDNLNRVLNDKSCNDPSKTPAENMKAMAGLYIKFTQDHRPHWLMLFQHTTGEGFEVPEWLDQKIESLFAPLENQMDDFFEKGQERMKRTAARILWSSVHGLCFLQETGKIGVVGQDKSMHTIAHYLIDIFIKGLK